MKVAIKVVLSILIFMAISTQPSYAFWNSIEQESDVSLSVGTWNYLQAPVWTSSSGYLKGQIVFHNGVYYIALRNVPGPISPSSPSGSNFWQLY